MSTDWRSYNDVAEVYSRVAEVHYFARPAQDLLALLDPAPGSRLLDAGAGSGAVTALAAAAVGGRGMVVGLDPAVSMLLSWRNRCPGHPVAGALPHLPHPDASFDSVAAAFVLTHVLECEGALNALVRVLKPSGRLGVSCWASSPSETPPGNVWRDTAHGFIDEAALTDALRTALPWEARFSVPDALKDALHSAGLRDAHVEQREYDVEMSTSSYLESRLMSLSSRFIQSCLPPDEWGRFKDQLSSELSSRFGPQVAFTVRVNLGVGVKRGDGAGSQRAAAIADSA
jgi:ubiquinone/menaquinone biosynthesis C-methylase UbiE